MNWLWKWILPDKVFGQLNLSDAERSELRVLLDYQAYCMFIDRVYEFSVANRNVGR